MLGCLVKSGLLINDGLKHFCGPVTVNDKKGEFDGAIVTSEVMGHHSIDFTRRRYALFSPESASRAVLRVMQDYRAAGSGAINGQSGV